MSNDPDLEHRVMGLLRRRPGGSHVSDIVKAIFGLGPTAEEWYANLARVEALCDKLVDEGELEEKLGGGGYYGIPNYIEKYLDPGGR
jgi:hypothetical protein